MPVQQYRNLTKNCKKVENETTLWAIEERWIPFKTIDLIVADNIYAVSKRTSGMNK